MKRGIVLVYRRERQLPYLPPTRQRFIEPTQPDGVFDPRSFSGRELLLGDSVERVESIAQPVCQGLADLQCPGWWSVSVCRDGLCEIMVNYTTASERFTAEGVPVVVEGGRPVVDCLWCPSSEIEFAYMLQAHRQNGHSYPQDWGRLFAERLAEEHHLVNSAVVDECRAPTERLIHKEQWLRGADIS